MKSFDVLLKDSEVHKRRAELQKELARPVVVVVVVTVVTSA